MLPPQQRGFRNQRNILNVNNYLKAFRQFKVALKKMSKKGTSELLLRTYINT